MNVTIADNYLLPGLLLKIGFFIKCNTNEFEALTSLIFDLSYRKYTDIEKKKEIENKKGGPSIKARLSLLDGFKIKP
jgi:hypothetical protein